MFQNDKSQKAERVRRSLLLGFGALDFWSFRPLGGQSVLQKVARRSTPFLMISSLVA